MLGFVSGVGYWFPYDGLNLSVPDVDPRKSAGVFLSFYDVGGEVFFVDAT